MPMAAKTCCNRQFKNQSEGQQQLSRKAEVVLLRCQAQVHSRAFDGVSDEKIERLRHYELVREGSPANKAN